MSKVSLFTHNFLDAYNQDFTRVFGGGLERYIYDLCGILLEMGYQPQVHQLSYFEEFHTKHEQIEVIGHAYDFDRIPEAFDRMAQRAEGPIVYASCIWHPIRYRPGSLGICHGINWDRFDLDFQAKAALTTVIQGALNGLQRIVSVDSHFLTYCRSACQFSDPEQIVRIPNAVDTGYFTPAANRERKHEETVRVLFPRRLSLERGLIQMMLVTDRLLAQYPHVEVEFAGEVVESSVQGRTFRTWHQAHPHRERILQRTYDFSNVRDAYQKADIAVIPTTYSEGTSYACLESMSCGLPVVASNVGGLNDLILDGYNGILVLPVSEPLHQALCALIEDPLLRERLGKQARQTAFAFDKSIWRARWRTVLEAYLGRTLA